MGCWHCSFWERCTNQPAHASQPCRPWSGPAGRFPDHSSLPTFSCPWCWSLLSTTQSSAAPFTPKLSHRAFSALPHPQPLLTMFCLPSHPDGNLHLILRPLTPPKSSLEGVAHPPPPPQHPLCLRGQPASYSTETRAIRREGLRLPAFPSAPSLNLLAFPSWPCGERRSCLLSEAP